MLLMRCLLDPVLACVRLDPLEAHGWFALEQIPEWPILRRWALCRLPRGRVGLNDGTRTVRSSGVVW